ncbi:MAG: peptide-methionine (S)-S-oxide reductase [Burkholderiaceae bacterium]|nr:MAG: peptide-methionine (S)-S-oxide reductase [Burkholderiaceae bacterium]
MHTEQATLGGGCFWCLEAVFDQVRGVTRVESGYAGGYVPQPTYAQVCEGQTGHAEVVQITFDPAVVSYQALLDIFFTIHDPTTPNQQGNDVGSQYRSVIFTHDEAQHATARATLERLTAEKAWPDPIVTELSPLQGYSAAEDYHQSYFEMHGHQPYCQFVVAPKVQKFRQKFAALLKE